MPDSAPLTGRFKAVFISPHLDDAVFACGGTIAQLAASERVLVMNVFTHYPAPFHQAGISVGRERYQEERRAAEFLGYRSVSLGQTDAILREAIGRSPARLFSPPGPADVAGIGALRERIETCLAGIDYETLYLPMGIGWHVDHLLCHLATRHHLGRPGVFLFEDAPYCLIPGATRYRAHEVADPPADPGLSAPRARGLLHDWLTASRYYLGTPPVRGVRPYPLRLAANLVVAGYIGRLMARHLRAPTPGSGRLEAVVNDISATFDRKISASYLYASQIGEFFRDRPDCVGRFRRYSATLGDPRHLYERFWQVRA